MTRKKSGLGVILGTTLIFTLSPTWAQNPFGIEALPISEAGFQIYGVAGSPFGAYLAAQHAQSESHLTRAADFVATAMKSDPDSAALQRSAVVIYLETGQIEEAATLLRKLDKSDFNPILRALTFAVDAVLKNDPQGAIEALRGVDTDRFLTLAVSLTRAWLAAGDLSLASPNDRLEAAIQAMQALKSNEAAMSLLPYQQGLIAEMLGLNEDASRFYSKIGTDSAAPSLRMTDLLGSFWQRRGDTASAKAIYEKFLTQLDSSQTFRPYFMGKLTGEFSSAAEISSLRDGLSELYLDLGASLMDQGNGGLALIFFGYASALRPDFDWTHYHLATFLARRHQNEDALQQLSHVLDNPLLGRVATIETAQILARQDRTDEAADLLRSLTAKSDGRIDAHIALGDIYRQDEQFGEAIGAYDGAIARLSAPEPGHWQLYYSRAVCLERVGRWPEAEASFLKALELEQDEPYVLNYLAYSWVDRGENLERAMEMLRKAVEKKPSDGFIIDSLGWAYYRLGQFDKAVIELERAVELTPADPVINDHLGDAYWKVGRFHEARFQWKRALTFKPDAKDVPTIEAKIKNGLNEG